MTAQSSDTLSAFFISSGETLLCACPVTKSKRVLSTAKKYRFLCITMRRGQLRVHKMKSAGVFSRGETGKAYQSSKAWRLEDLRRIDGEGQSSTSSETDFTFKFEKSYHWRCATPRHKNALLWLVIVLSRHHLGKTPQLTRLDEMELRLLGEAQNLSDLYEDEGKGLMDAAQAVVDVRQTRGNTVSATSAPSNASSIVLSAAEQADVESLFASSGVGVADVDAFTDSLSRENDASEAANIHAILESQRQVADLLMGIDTVVADIDNMSRFVTEYNTQLTAMRDIIKQIEMENNRMEVVSRNNLSLLESLDGLLAKIQLDPNVVNTLSNPDFSTTAGLATAVAAALELDTVMQDPSIGRLRQMRAVKEQLKKHDSVRDEFAIRAFDKINSVIKKSVDEMSFGKISMKGTIIVPDHRDVLHSPLIPYSNLARWLRSTSRRKFDEMLLFYTTTVQRVYKKELGAMLHELKAVVLKRKMESRYMYVTMVDRDSSSQSMLKSLSKSSSHSFLLHPSQSIGESRMGRADSVSSTGSFEASSATASDMHVTSDTTVQDFNAFLQSLITGRPLQTEDIVLSTKGAKKISYDVAFRFLLGMVVPVIAAEQNFMAALIGVGGVDDDESSDEDEDDSVAATPQEIMAANQMPVADQWEVAETLQSLLHTLPEHLQSLLAKAEKYDELSLISFLSTCRDFQNQFGDHSVFLSNLLEPLCAKAEEAFRKHVLEQSEAIVEAKAAARRCGILLPVSKFYTFIDVCESFFEPQPAVVRAVLEKAYGKIGGAVNSLIDRVAHSDSKYCNVVMLENHHHIFNSMKKRKFAKDSVVSKMVVESIAKYNSALERYVKSSINREFQSLFEYFRGIVEMMNGGMPEEEVKYRFSHSIQAYKKLVKSHSQRDVEKGVLAMKKRVERQLCKEEALYGEVWQAVSESFKETYTEYANLAIACYPDTTPMPSYVTQNCTTYTYSLSAEALKIL